MPRSKNFTSELIPAALLILTAVIFFHNIILSGSTLFGSDFLLQFYPWKKFVHDYAWSKGALPFWNPYLFSGTPFIANIQASMFYPLGFLFYIMPAEHAYGYTIMMHSILGSIFMYLFMRSLSVNRIGAFLAAVIFAYNGFFMAHIYAGHLSFVQNYIWIPLIFLFLHKFIDTSDFRYATLAGLCLGIQILGGFPQIGFYTILAVLAYGLFRMAMLVKTGNLIDVARHAFGLFLIVCLGFAIAAIQVLPTLEFTKFSTRAGGLSYDFATYDSLHPKMFLSFLIPEIFGNVVDQTYWISPENWHFWETCGYVGIIPLFLVFFSTPKRYSLSYIRLFFVSLIVLALFLALGKYNPVYSLVYRLPGFRSFRIPAQILFLYVFGVAVVSGIVVNQAERELIKRRKAFETLLVATGAGFLLIVLATNLAPYRFFFHLFRSCAEVPVELPHMEIIGEKITSSVNRSALLFFTAVIFLVLLQKKKIPATLFRIILVVVAILDLGLFSVQFIKPYKFTFPQEKQALVDQMEKQPEQGRVLTSKSIFLPNDGLLYHFRDIGGYDPLILKRYIYYLQASQRLPMEKHIITTTFVKDADSKLLQMLNVTDVVRGKKLSRLEKAVPEAILVNKAVIKPTEEVLDFLASDAFDPRNMVVFEPEYQPYLVQSKNGDAYKRACSITHFANERIAVRTVADQPGYLVLSELFYPGWKATVDGRKAPILRGNYIFRVVPLTAGRHDVELRFVSWPFWIGAVISLLTLVGSLVFVTRKRKQVSRR